MAAAQAQAARDSAVENLESSVRQLPRYIDTGNLDGGNINLRILQQKMQKVSVAKDELIEAHHVYGEKSDTPISYQTMREFIEP